MMNTTPIHSNGAHAVDVAYKVVEAWNSHDPQQLLPLYAKDYRGIDVAQAQPINGAHGITGMLTRYVEAFPDLNFNVVDLVEQDGRVSLHWIATGTHQGRIMNIPPTGRSIEVRGVSIMSIAGGKVRHGYMIWDVAGLLRSIGLLPEL